MHKCKESKGEMARKLVGPPCISVNSCIKDQSEDVLCMTESSAEAQTEKTYNVKKFSEKYRLGKARKEVTAGLKSNWPKPCLSLL